MIPTALAEVMDKEPRLSVIWAVFLGLAVAGVLLTRFRWWLGLVSAGLAAAIGWLWIHLELADPYVGPAIRAEAPLYATQAYMAIGIAVLAPLSVAVRSRLRRVA